MIETTLGWTVHSRAWLRHIEDQLSDRQKGVRDELGVLAVHSAFADRFFPGTSVLQTRLRYVLFVPWMYGRLGAMGLGPAFRDELAVAEVRLVGQLMQTESDGVIGARVHPRAAVQLPSMIYWTAIRTFGLLRRVGTRFPSRRAVHQLLAYRDRSLGLKDDDGAPIEPEFMPFSEAIPDPPDAFGDSRAPVDFALTEGERSFLTERLGSVTRDTDGELTLLARLAVEPTAAAECKEPWDPRIRGLAGEQDRRALLVARRASHLVAVVRAAYAALVETVREAEDGFDSVREHRLHLERVLDRSAGEAERLDLEELFDLMPGSNADGRLYDVLQRTQEWLTAGTSNLGVLREPYARQEAAKKGSRARLPETVAAQERRVEWTFPLQYGLDYRWSHVQVFLADLADHG